MIRSTRLSWVSATFIFQVIQEHSSSIELPSKEEKHLRQIEKRIESDIKSSIKPSSKRLIEYPIKNQFLDSH